jgi:hypothetical protein
MRKQRKAVATLGSADLDLNTFLSRLAEVDERFPEMLEGIYCGREGRVCEYIPNSTNHLVFNWYTRENGRCVVEYAYIS